MPKSTFQCANEAFRSKQYTDALRLYDTLAKLQPRNYQIRLNAVWACIKSAQIIEAKKRLELIDQTLTVDPIFITKFVDMLAAKKAELDSTPWLEIPTDYLRPAPNGVHLSRFRSIKFDKRFPKGYPFDLELPAIHGNGNNYKFIIDAVNRHQSSVVRCIPRCLIVAFVSSDNDTERIFELLKKQTVALNNVELLLFTSHKVTAMEIQSPCNSRRIQYDFNRSVEQINDQVRNYQGDFILFFQRGVCLNQWLLENIGYYHQVTTKAVHVFSAPVGEMNSSNPIRDFDAASEVDWCGERYGFRYIKTANLVVSMKYFRQLLGLNGAIRSLEIAFQEFGYRLFLNGAYFLPAPSMLASSEKSQRKWNGTAVLEADEKFDEFCAVNWWRKSDGHFKVPKVSIYIPSYNNSRYIVQSIHSVLEQDFKDLEVCVWDDGSTDDTLQKLQTAFRDDLRVRVMAGPNGGIGVASNRAVEMSRGMYIGQLDSDDLLKPGSIRKLVEYLDKFPETGCVYSSCERIDANGIYVSPEYSFPVFSREKMMMTSIAHHFRMFRRQSWARTAGFREDILNAVDYDMFLKLSEVTKFHHIEETLYQRRWHGNNTSFVNESAQSSNTTVVLNKSLWRQGMSGHWQASAPNPVQPRQIAFRRRSKVTRVFFWPDYSKDNPYQKLLYGRLDSRYEVIAGDIDSALKSIADHPESGQVVFHLHWTSSFFGGSEEEVKGAILAFEAKLTKFRKKGGKLVWTVHNAATHDGKNLGAELKFFGRLSLAADRIHVHSMDSVAELGFNLPVDKLVVIPHGNYLNYYPDYITRADARRHLGISGEEFVLLFTGQVRPYKGLERLLDAFSRKPDQQRWRLIIAGKSTYDFEGYLKKSVSNEIISRILFIDRFLDDHSLQLFYRSADVAVFPYEKILTSGSALLAMSFGVPPILPKVGMVEELLEHGKCGFTFETRDTAQLLKTLCTAFDARNTGTLSGLSECALKRARSLNWEGIEKLFLFAE